MPAVLDDPASPTLYRVSGPAPSRFTDRSRASTTMPPTASLLLPYDIFPRKVTLRDRQTVATIVPFSSHVQLPPSLLAYLCDQFNKEIEGGDTYPMTDAFSPAGFAAYWFQNFGAVMLLGHIGGAEDVHEGKDWSKECLGSFSVKPNYPGRSSHVCNASFIVTDASRNRGVGRLMGESYIDWAPRLGYTYSVFNLVYETNVASCRIWDALGFKRIGRVKGCGNLRSHPGRLIDAIIYGRDLGPGDGEELVSEERFDKIKFYLKTGKYPNGADRAEKSRLRSAATHYKLLEDDKLMLKNKEVISDPIQQYDIARATHAMHHGGINKTTASISEKYHWSRIKETVSDVIRNCAECKELGKTPNPGGVKKTTTTATTTGGTPTVTPVPTRTNSNDPSTSHMGQVAAISGQAASIDTAAQTLGLPDPAPPMMSTFSHSSNASFADPKDISVIPPSHTLQRVSSHHHHHHHHHHQLHSHGPMLHEEEPHHHHPHESTPVYHQPIDPQIINNTTTTSDTPHHEHHHHDSPFDQYHATHAEDFQALLDATEDVDDVVVVPEPQEDTDAVARDLEMLITHEDDDDDDQHSNSNTTTSNDRNNDVDVIMDGHPIKNTRDENIPNAFVDGDETMSDALVDGDDKTGKERSIYDLEFHEPGG